MAITYNVAKCKNGWGVYVRAISGDDLRVFTPSTIHSVMRVRSGRLARKRSKRSAKNFIARLRSLPRAEQLTLISSRWLSVAPSAYKVVRVQTLKVFRETDDGQFIPQTTTINRPYAESVALFYSQVREKQSFLRKTATRYLKLPLNTQTEQLNIL